MGAKMANDECYTPMRVIRRVRRVLGEIDLDPATCEIANETVGAKSYFTESDNGLIRRWHGRVFCNPPYSRDLVKRFIKKILSEWDAGNVEEMVILLNNITGTRGGAALMSACQGVCFVTGRIAFYGPGLDGKSKGDQDSMIVYFGTRPALFFEVFCEIGVCCVPSRIKQLDLFGMEV
ncbi:MAG: hypothetical protein EOM20_19535 [Spartobacteria bacterium]|nr:hypothetical protein [Spartobacteria bacterium]